MSIYLTETMYRFCSGDQYSFYLQNRKAYLWIASKWIDDEEEISRGTFIALLNYFELHKRSPASIESFLAYVVGLIAKS